MSHASSHNSSSTTPDAPILPERHTRKEPDRSPREPRPRQRLLTRAQIAMEYGFPSRTIYDFYLRGRLPAVRLNRSLWFERADVERLITTHKEVLA